jgi:septation ring formation regulator EzrA
MSQRLMPPVPQGLRDMLKDYPEHIERLQEVLNRNMESGSSLMPFDEAIWSLEGRLETFISEARQELRVAEANGDSETIAAAHKKLNLMFQCRPSGSWKLKELMQYCDDLRART